LFLLVFFEFKSFWSSPFLFASVLSITVGSISALFQKRIKRLFAYSTISHTGFILLGVVAASPDSTNSLIFYVLIYSALTVLLFSLLIFAIVTQKNFPAYIANWTSSSLRNYVFVISLTVVLFSIAGIPPLAGFFSKLSILLSIVMDQFYVTALVIVIISSIASFYYIRLIKSFFFVKTRKNNFWIASSKRQGLELNVGLLMFFNLAFATHPELISLMSSTLSFSIF
jgi:NADH-quinone oxidoreductase subunit N